MKKKLLGLSCGRKLGNSEILLKEALMAAERTADIEVEIVRLLELNLMPCNGCESCMRPKGINECMFKEKDDMVFLRDKFAECDGLIVSAPVYILGPPGYLKMMNDRFLGFGLEFRRKIFESGMTPKVGASIAVGGTDWTQPALPLMSTIFFPLRIKMVDQLQVNWVGRPGQAVMRDDAIAKARQLGQRVAASIGRSLADIRYLGDDPGICPSCHNNLLVIGKNRMVECPICDIKGEVTIENNEIVVRFLEESLKNYRWTPEGRKGHLHDIHENFRYADENKAIIAKKRSAYKSYKAYSRPSVQRGVPEIDEEAIEDLT